MLLCLNMQVFPGNFHKERGVMAEVDGARISDRLLKEWVPREGTPPTYSGLKLNSIKPASRTDFPAAMVG